MVLPGNMGRGNVHWWRPRVLVHYSENGSGVVTCVGMLKAKVSAARSTPSSAFDGMILGAAFATARESLCRDCHVSTI